MFKSLSALFRGQTNDQMEKVVDRNAMTILRQQIRDCTHGVATARKAVAVAIAQNEQEIVQHKKLVSRISDLESRTIRALEKDEIGLAKEAAETIALLEAERDASGAAQARFKTEIDRLKKAVRESEARLRELQRGQRLANASDKTQKMRSMVPNGGLSALKDAETTLKRLRNRQREIDATANVMDEMALCNDPGTMSERLAEAGCGAPIKSSAREVLERLKQKSSGKAGKKKDGKKAA